MLYVFMIDWKLEFRPRRTVFFFPVHPFSPLLSIKLPIVRTQVLWTRSIDEKENVKYMFRIFGWRKHYAIWRKTRKAVLNYDPLWSIRTALISPLLHAHCVKAGLLWGKRTVLPPCSFPAIIHCGQSLQGTREKEKRRERERKINHRFDEWAISFLTCSGFPFSHRKASYSVANSGALSLMSITLMATIALDIWLWFPNIQNRNHKRGRDKRR